MLFNSEPRFNKDLKPQKFNDISGYGKVRILIAVFVVIFNFCMVLRFRYVKQSDMLDLAVIFLKGMKMFGEFLLAFFPADVVSNSLLLFLFSGGWHHKSFSQRQPMTSSSRRDDRTIHYTNGLLLPSGILVPGSPKKMPTPGPGYYGGPLSPVSVTVVLAFYSVV